MTRRIGLKIAILKAGKTQRQLAHETGLPENRLSTLVNGWCEPRSDERERLARALEQDENQLFALTTV
jgi:hypothetical protein